MADVIYGPGGWCVEWFVEYVDGGAFVARWYGSRAECVARAAGPEPADDDPAWVQCGGEGGPSYDAATATGMYDRDF